MELRRSLRRSSSRISQRIPLANLTNDQSLSSSSSSALFVPKPHKPQTSDPRPALSSTSKPAAAPSRSGSSIASRGPRNPSGQKVSNSDRADAVTSYKSKHSVVNSRPSTEGRKEKGKVAAPVSASCYPPREMIRSAGHMLGKSKAENRDVGVLGTSSVPYKKNRKLKKLNFLDDEVLKNPLMSQDYIERQRAYFAEIDAFDLPEEIVSENELE